MNKILKFIIAVNLIVLLVLVFIYPHLMVAPGKLNSEHKHLETDCFACHAPLRGASSERCIACHKPAEIGRLTTTGNAIVKTHLSIPFHQKLISQDCVACHSEHAGVIRFQQKARFNHTLLGKDTVGQCQDCHQSPGDSLHQQITGNCTQCHTQEKWLPTTFDHTKYFALDGDHNTRCVTCHVRNDYSHYTCYGCHEHSPSNIRSEHIEEGIQDFNNCVDCHRSANEKNRRKGNGKHESEGEEDD